MNFPKLKKWHWTSICQGHVTGHVTHEGGPKSIVWRDTDLRTGKRRRRQLAAAARRHLIVVALQVCKRATNRWPRRSQMAKSHKWRIQFHQNSTVPLMRRRGAQTGDTEVGVQSLPSNENLKKPSDSRGRGVAAHNLRSNAWSVEVGPRSIDWSDN